MVSKHALTCGMIVLLIMTGCASAVKQRKEVGASVETNQKWKMKEACGSEDCDMLVDFLVGADMTMRIEFDNDPQTKQFMMVRTDFSAIKKEITYAPSAVTLALADGSLLKPKVFSCYYTIWDVASLRARPSLEGTFLLPKQDSLLFFYDRTKQDCYLLFFDHPAFSNGEEAVMDLNNAFTIDGKKIGMPLIHFKKK